LASWRKYILTAKGAKDFAKDAIGYAFASLGVDFVYVAPKSKRPRLLNKKTLPSTKYIQLAIINQRAGKALGE